MFLHPHDCMTLPPRRAAGLLFIAAAVLAAVGALVPYIRGREASGALLAFVVVWLVLGVVMLRGGAGDSGGGDA